MRATLARRAETMFARATALNLENIERSLQAATPDGRLVDLGCDDVTSRRAGLGNPLAVHRGEAPGAVSWQHARVSYRGLRELFESHGLDVRDVFGAGYFPFLAVAGRLEPRHAAFLTVMASRLESPQ